MKTHVGNANRRGSFGCRHGGQGGSDWKQECDVGPLRKRTRKVAEESGLLVGKGEVSCSLLLPPESPFVFWSIAGLAYLGLAYTLFLI